MTTVFVTPWFTENLASPGFFITVLISSAALTDQSFYGLDVPVQVFHLFWLKGLCLPVEVIFSVTLSPSVLPSSPPSVCDCSFKKLSQMLSLCHLHLKDVLLFYIMFCSISSLRYLK